MKALPGELVRFLNKQGFVIVSTIDEDGTPHTACKGIVQVDGKGELRLVDLYTGRTYRNLVRNPRISVTAVDEHRFKGYCLKGEARLESSGGMQPEVAEEWRDRITSRIASRVIKNVQGERGHPRHPEARLPKPKALIVMEVREIIDLTPKHIK